MKIRIFKSILTLAFVFMALPMMCQDFMLIHFKNGDFRKFYMNNITEITISKIDADGIQHSDYNYQYITTIYDKYIYSIEDVDSITYTKIDEEQAEHNFVTAMPIVINTISDCETIDDVEKKIDVIKNTEGIVDAWSDGHQLYVAIAQDEVYSFHFNHDSNMGNDDYSNMAKQVKALLPQLKTISKKDGTPLKAVIANQQHKDESRKYKPKYFYDLRDAFNSSGIIAHYVEEPTVDFFYDHCENPETAKHLNLYDYDIIFLITHGSYHPVKIPYFNYFYLEYRTKEGEICHHITTSDDIAIIHGQYTEDDMIWLDYYKEFKEWRKKKKFKGATEQQLNYSFNQETRNGEKVWVVHPYITEFFFDEIAKGMFLNPESIFFNAACQSVMGDEGKPSFTLVDELFKKNLGVYVGYDQWNNTGQERGRDFFYSMLNGYSSDSAYEELEKEEYHEEDSMGKWWAYMHKKENPNNDYSNGLFIIPVVTNKIDEEKVLQEFNQTGMVTVYGSKNSISTLQEKLKFGFEVTYYDPVTNTRHINAETTPVCYNNKVEFYANIDNLLPGRTYYYRAYTFDGIHHNYGETYSFKIEETPVYPDLQLSSSEINLEVGKSGTVEITAGSGEYEYILSNDGIVSVSISGSTVTINALQARKTTVIIVDTKSSQTATIDVSVTVGGDIPSYTSCPDSHHPHLIDLGLPSGTKWACCNVGAQMPEDYGGCFAWGETVEKSSYTSSNYLDGKGTSYNIGKDIAGTQYDAATANWGSPWVMPNREQMDELVNSCSSEWTTENGVNGRRFTGSNGASIFLPAAGSRWKDDMYNAGSYGRYWLSTLSESYASDAWSLYFGSGDVRTRVYYRYYGQSVRPVKSDTAPDYPDLQLSETQISIVKGSSNTVEITSGSGEYGVTNLNSSIARGTLQGTTITISALAEGDAKVVATDMQSGQKIIIEITVTIGGDIVAYTSCPDSHHPHLIDLGLPSGTKWACCNVGAEKPEDYGGFAWGETKTKSSYTSDNYLDGKGTSYDIGNDIAGTQYDAATVKWGSPWVMPSKEQMDELLYKCFKEWTTENGINGKRFTGPNGASIFLPAAGGRLDSDSFNIGSFGHYWSSSLNYTSYPFLLDFEDRSARTYYDYLINGLTIRPVCKN